MCEPVKLHKDHIINTGNRSINATLSAILISDSVCSEISCNVKWNVYLAMEIPDRVSFVSRQNSDEIVRSCELSWRFF